MEDEKFYDMCDEAGILIWQGFPLGSFPGGEDGADRFVQENAPKLKQIAEELYNHACIACWSVYSEGKAISSHLYHMLIESVKTADPIRWVHSAACEERDKNAMAGLCRGDSLPGSIIKEQIEIYRRSMYKPLGSIGMFYWNNLKIAPEDCQAVKQAYEPVLVSFEGSGKKFSQGSQFAGNIWIANDRAEQIDNADLCWAIKDSEGRVLAEGQSDFGIDKDCAKIVNNVVYIIPQSAAAGSYVLEMTAAGANGKTLSRNSFEFDIG